MHPCPSKGALRAVLSRALEAGVTVAAEPRPLQEDGHYCSPPRPQALYAVDLSNGRGLLLVTAPPAMIRLLRSERLLVESEAAVVRWLREALTREKLAVAKVLNVNDAAPCSPGVVHIKEEEDDGEDGEDGEGMKHTQQHVDLLDMVPPLIAAAAVWEPVATALEPPYAVFGRPCGDIPTIPFAHCRAAADPAGRKAVDYQIGSLVRRLSRMTSPTGQFGPAMAALTPAPPDGVSPKTAGPTHHTGRGMWTWSTAFHAIMEGVLRDAEDMAVTIPYATIRRHVRRLCPLLDSVATPRLVMVDAAEYSNVLVLAREDLIPRRRGDSWTDVVDAAGTARRREPPTVAGLADWSNCVFGDALFARVFSEQPSGEFLRGFYGWEEEDDDLVGDRDTHTARLLLYSCHHLVVTVVREFYRPSRGSSARELEARRRLADVLARLAGVDGEEVERRRSGGLGMMESACKRARLGEECVEAG